MVQDVGFLLAAHRDRVLVAVAVHADLMPGRGHLVELLTERLDGVPGPEPGGGQPVALEQSAQARHPDLAGEHAARDVTG